MQDDGGMQYWQTLGLQEQFNDIFKDKKNDTANDEKISKTVSSEFNIMESRCDKQK
jgi:hypothetical protein